MSGPGPAAARLLRPQLPPPPGPRRRAGGAGPAPRLTGKRSPGASRGVALPPAAPLPGSRPLRGPFLPAGLPARHQPRAHRAAPGAARGAAHGAPSSRPAPGGGRASRPGAADPLLYGAFPAPSPSRGSNSRGPPGPEHAAIPQLSPLAPAAPARTARPDLGAPEGAGGISAPS